MVKFVRLQKYCVNERSLLLRKIKYPKVKKQSDKFQPFPILYRYFFIPVI
jgi:hypothetical protein